MLAEPGGRICSSVSNAPEDLGRGRKPLFVNLSSGPILLRVSHRALGFHRRQRLRFSLSRLLTRARSAPLLCLHIGSGQQKLLFSPRRVPRN